MGCYFPAVVSKPKHSFSLVETKDRDSNDDRAGLVSSDYSVNEEQESTQEFIKRIKEQRKKLMEKGIVDGKWGPWGSWSSCDSKREKKRTRKCDSPAPLYGGMYCPGDSKEEALCPGLVSSDYSGSEEQESNQEFMKRLKE